MVEERSVAEDRWRRRGRFAVLLVAAALLHLPLLQSAPKPLTPGERALAAIARQALLGGDRVFDYGGFFLHAEGAAGGSVERRWRGLATALREQLAPLGGRHADEGVGKMMLLLFREARMGKYRREEARMSGYFQEVPGGNCEAQTKLLVSALRASTMTPPAGKELGVEVYQDHVQAVLVDRRRGTLWNLMTGEEDAKPRSDVYRPAVLLAAYLRGLGLRPPIPEGDLRLLRGPRPQALRRGWAFFTTSTMKLPAAVARFAEGPTPELAELPLPVPRRPDPPPSGSDKAAVGRQEFLQDHDAMQLFAMDRIEAPVGLVGSTLVFRRPEQAERYLALASQAERRRLLLQLAEERLRTELTPGVPVLPPLEQLASWSETALTERLRRVERVEQLVAQAEISVDRGRSSSMVAGELELQLPELRRAGESVRTFAAEAARRPEGFVRGLSALDRPRRRALLSFLVPRFPSAQVKTLALALGDPAQVALVSGDQGPPLPAAMPLAFTEVELLDTPAQLQALLGGPSPGGTTGGANATSAAGGSTPTGGPVPPSGTSGIGGPTTRTKPADAAPLAVGAYLDLVLSGLFSSGDAGDMMPILERWEAGFSEHLVQMAAGDRCPETLVRLQMAAIRPLNEAGRPTPAHLEAVVRKLERLCKR
jgi:hypothetical protein